MLGLVLILAIPTGINLLAVCFWRGWARALAAIPLMVLVCALGLDSYSASKRGNLTGLFTMITALPALGVLATIGLINGAIALARQPRQGEAARDRD